MEFESLNTFSSPEVPRSATVPLVDLPRTTRVRDDYIRERRPSESYGIIQNSDLYNNQINVNSTYEIKDYREIFNTESDTLINKNSDFIVPKIIKSENYNLSTSKSLGRYALGGMVKFEEVFSDITSRADMFDSTKVFPVRRNPGVVLDDFTRYGLDLTESSEQRTARERVAHKFRSGRLRMGELRTITTELQDPSNALAKAGVSSVVKRGEKLTDGTFEEGERHRLYAPLIAALYGTPETREKLIAGIDANVAEETARLKQEAQEANEAGEQMTTEWLIIGSGMHGAIAAAELRSQLPEDRIVMIDKSEKLGGQFANYGDRPVFYGNSRANRKQKTGTTELPGGDGNINSFGPHAPVQLPDLTRKTYWTNTEMADSIRLNGYMSAEAMQETAVERVEYVRGATSREDAYKVTIRDTITGELMDVTAKNVIVTTGLGERIALAEVDSSSVEGFLSVEELLKKFADNNNQFPMDEFEGKRIAVVGGGDSARIAMELFTRLAPEAAYGRSSVQMGDGPESIDWYGVDFEDRDGFCASNRPRYNQIASFVDRKAGDSLIHPKPATKVMDVIRAGDGIALEYTAGDSRRTLTPESYDFVIDATTLVSQANDPFDRIDGEQVAVASSTMSTDRTVVYGQQIQGHRIVFAGPAAKSPLTRAEKDTFAKGIRENTAALWANGPRTVKLASILAKVARRNRKI